MTLNIINETGRTPDFSIDRLCEEITEAALDRIDCPYECQIDITITDNETIKKINKEQRGIDQATDVLSFPVCDLLEGDFTPLEKPEKIFCFDPDTGELLLGDVVISLDKAEAQAKEYNHSVKREFAFLLVHSILHLSGFDHMDEVMEKRMLSLQDDILNILKITRDKE